jgi:hypothetical protein
MIRRPLLPRGFFFGVELMRTLMKSKDLQIAIDKAIYARKAIMNSEGGSWIGKNDRSVQELLVFCRDFVDRPINLLAHPDSWHNHKVKSFYVQYDDKYEIVYLKDLNNCWMRFCLCKELFHILLQDPSNCSVEIKSHVGDVLFTVGIESTDSSGMKSTQVEYLFPYFERKKWSSIINIDFMSIANKYLIPRDYVEIYLHSNSMSSLSETQFNYQ